MSKITNSNSPVKFVQGSYESYMKLVNTNTIDNTALYFLSDVGSLFKGTMPMSNVVYTTTINISVTDGTLVYPQPPASLVIPKYAKILVYGYNVMSGETLEYTAYALYTVEGEHLLPISVPGPYSISTTGQGLSYNDKVSSQVLFNFVEKYCGKFIDNITYNEETKSLNYTVNAVQKSLDINGFVTGASYSNGILEFNVSGGKKIDINLPKDNFVTSGKYNPETKAIDLTLVSGEVVSIPAAALVTQYTATDTKSINLTINGDTISADVKISAAANNTLKINEDGLFVSAGDGGSGLPDASNYLEKVATNKGGSVIIANDDGSVSASNIKAGSTTLSDNADGTTLATETAVRNMLAWYVMN